MARDKLDLDIFWLKDDALDDPDLLPPPDEVAAEVVESLEAALASFRSVAAKLQGLSAAGPAPSTRCGAGRQYGPRHGDRRRKA